MANLRNHKKEIITDTFIKLLGVQVLLAAFSSLNGFVDNLFASNYLGQAAVSTIGLYAPVNTAIGIIGISHRNASQILCGKLMGKDQVARTKSVFSVDIISVTIIGLIAWVIMFVFTEPLSHLLLAEKTGAVLLQQYLKVLSFGVLPLLIGIQLSSFLSIERQFTLTNLITIMMIAVNAIMNYVFICKMSLGIKGLALATVISYWVFALSLMVFYLTDKAIIHFDHTVIDVRDFKRLFQTGTGYLIYSAYVVVQGLFINWMILKVAGESALASYSLASTIMAVAWALPSGVLAVCRILISIYVSEQDKESLLEVFRILLKRILIIVIILSALIAIAARPLVMTLYTNSAVDTYLMTILILHICPWSLPLITITWVYETYAGQIGKGRLSSIITALEAMVATVVLCPILTFFFGTNGIWYATVAPGVITVIIILVHAARTCGHRPATMEELVALPAEFGVPDEDRLNITIRNIKEVTATAELVQGFCRSKGVDEQRSYYAALCLEEMAANIVQHGYTKDSKKQHSIVIRVTNTEDELILRLKDDCIPFNPAERQKLIDPDDKLSNIGIRMVYKLAKEITYHNILRLNVLTIRI